jgi:hypothetical protein
MTDLSHDVEIGQAQVLNTSGFWISVHGTNSLQSSTLQPPFSSQSIPSEPPPVLEGTSTTPATNVALRPIDSLPTIAGWSSRRYPASHDIASFLQQDLNLDRLNRIHNHLWTAGRQSYAKPIHRYRMLDFEFVGTQQMDLHLVSDRGSPNRLMLKPLSEWILSHDFWVDFICKDEDLYRSACGFLLSYVWLIITPLDLKIAHDTALLPKFVTWYWWRAFVLDFLDHVDLNGLHEVSLYC